MRISKNSKINKLVCQFFVIFIFIILAVSTGNCFAMLVEQKDSIDNLSFSHDGKSVVFDRCREGDCQIQVYNLETGELAAYQSPHNEQWTMGKYSYDGKKITFSVIPIKPNDDLDLGNMQIAVMDADGKNFKKVTTGPGAKLYPTFSHNGKKILYACAARIREKGKTPAADYDAWEVNLETGKQTQLTFFEYFYMSNLTYFPDDERFIYYGDRPVKFNDVSWYKDETAFGNKMIELERQGRGIHGVVVMKGKELITNSYKFPAETFPQKPLLSKDGTVLIYEKSMSAGKFFLYSPDGNHRLLDESGSVTSAAISSDGEILATIPFSGLTLGVTTVRDGNTTHCLYLPCAPKKITNWSIPQKYKHIYKMIPEKPSRIIN
jgi:Tol biopolymer transport system component